MLERLNSIKSKIVILYLILLVFTFFGAGLFLQYSLCDYFSQWLDKKLLQDAKLLREVLEPVIFKQDSQQLKGLVANYGKQLGARITIVDSQGQVLADSREEAETMDNHLHRPEIQEAIQEGSGKALRYSNTLDMDMRYIALPIKHSPKEKGIIRIAMSLDKLNQMYSGLWKVLFQAGIAALVVSILLSIKFAAQITEPIKEMTNLAERIANGFLDQKLVVKTRDEIGQLGKVFNHMVTRFRNKMEQISSEKSKVEAVIASIGDGIIAVDEDNKIIMLNRAAEEIFKVKEEEVLGKSTIQITRNYKLVELIKEALAEAETLTEEIELLLPEERIFRLRLAPIKQEEEIAGVVVSLRDITEIRKLQVMRTEFVSNVSHELKTPLTSIKGYVETLLGSDLDSETTDSFLEVIEDEAERLERLIEDTLSLSKIESEGVLEKEEVAVEDLITDIRPILEPKAEKKKIDLNFQLEAELPTLMGDWDQLPRALINLIDNGIKYTPEGGQVGVRSYLEEEKIIIEVEDDGIGIPEQDLPRIFERFYRVDKARSRELGGTGLGLSIVKHVVDQHNGQISVESEVEQGTKFTIEFPSNITKEQTDNWS